MAFSIYKILKGLLITEENTLTPKEIEIVPGGTASTKTTLESSQTTNKTITLPDATDTLVGKATTDTLTNKSIDADTNTITNIEDADIKALAAIDATKIADGSVTSTEFQYLSGVTSDIQTQLGNNATAISDHLSDTTDAHAASAITNTPSGNLAATEVQAALNELQSDVDARVLASSPEITAPLLMAEESSTPSTPALGKFKIYPKDGGKLYTLNDDGTETEVGAGGGGGNIFSGNTNLTGPYYGDVIVYDGTATITGNLDIYGNLKVVKGPLDTGGDLVCTGDYSLKVTGDLYVQGKFDYLPTTGGQSIEVNGDMTVVGKVTTVSNVLGPFDIVGTSFTDFTTTSDLTGVNSGDTFEIITGNPSYPYTATIQFIQQDFPFLGVSTVSLDNMVSFSPGETWQVNQSTVTKEDLSIRGYNAISLTVGGNLTMRALDGTSKAEGIKSLDVLVYGSVYGTQDQQASGQDVSQITVDGSPDGGSSGGNVIIKGSLYNCSLSSNGTTNTASFNAGVGGEIKLGGWTANDNNIIQSKGGITFTGTANAGNGGNIYIWGSTYGGYVLANGGNSEVNTVAGSAGGNGGIIQIYGNNTVALQSRGGDRSNGGGNGGNGGNINVHGDNFRGIDSIGGSGYGAYNSGASGQISIEGNSSYGPINSYGVTGTSGAKGGNAGNVLIYGSVSGNINIVTYGGNSSGNNYIGGNGGQVLIQGGMNVISQILSYGGNGHGTGTGGVGGQIFLVGYSVISSPLDASGGNSTSGTAGGPGNVFIRGGGSFDLIKMTDGTGTASVNAPFLELSGDVVTKTINMTNRAGCTIRGKFSSIGACSLYVNVLTAKDVFVSAANTNPTASQAASCAGRKYIYDSTAAVWKYVAYTNA